MGEIYRKNVRLEQIAIASGETQSSWQMIRGYALGELTIPAGFKGQVKYRVKHGSTHSGGFAYSDDNATTAIRQAVAGLTKPLTLGIKPSVFAAAFVQVVATSAQTANKTLDMYIKG